MSHHISMTKAHFIHPEKQVNILIVQEASLNFCNKILKQNLMTQSLLVSWKAIGSKGMKGREYWLEGDFQREHYIIHN